jgi:hypothetical protein
LIFSTEIRIGTAGTTAGMDVGDAKLTNPSQSRIIEIAD